LLDRRLDTFAVDRNRG